MKNFPGVPGRMEKVKIDLDNTAKLPEEIAETLSIQTAIGSSQLALNSADDLLTLKKKVMSPGGTTEAAFDLLEEKKLDDIWDEAIDAARQRSVDLGKH